MRRPDVTPGVVAAIVAGTLALAQLVMLAGPRTELPVLPDAPRESRMFLLQQIPNGTAVSQLLNVQGSDLDGLELAGTLASPAQSGFVDFTLVELSNDAVEHEVRTATVAVTDSCCVFAFEPLRDSAGGRYRLDLKIRDFDASAPLSLRVVLLDHISGLTVNGHPQAATLVFSGSSAGITALARLQQRSPNRRLSFGGLLVLLIVLDAAIACGAAALARVFVTASG